MKIIFFFQFLDVKIKKAVFIIICQGDSLNEKILKACKAFHCNLYPCPSSEERREELEKEALTGIKETEQVSKKKKNLKIKHFVFELKCTNVKYTIGAQMYEINGVKIKTSEDLLKDKNKNFEYNLK